MWVSLEVVLSGYRVPGADSIPEIWYAAVAGGLVPLPMKRTVT